MTTPTAKKENTINGGVVGDCCICGGHTHHGTPDYKGFSGRKTGVVCPGCLPVAILGLRRG